MPEISAAQDRAYGLDLFKMLSMFLVIVLHVLGQGGVLAATDSTQPQYYTAWLLEAGSFCAVDCFALTTGYLMVGRTVRYRKILPLWLTVFLYSALGLVVGFLYFPETMSIVSLLNLFPVTTAEYWYFSAYFCMFFFIPFLNKLLEHMDRRQTLLLLATGFFLFCFVQIAKPVGIDPFGLYEGYTPWWLIYLYFAGAAIKKYDLFHRVTARLALVGYLVSVLLTWGIRIGICWVESLQFPNLSSAAMLYGHDRFVSYLSPTVVASGIFLLLFCARLRIPRPMGRVLAFLSPLVFQVYIIHVNPIIWNNLLMGHFLSYASAGPIRIIGLVLGTALCIFLLCIFIDWIRSLLFRLLHIDPLIDRLANGLMNFIQKHRQG